MKGECNKDMESLSKKSQAEILEIKSPLNQLKIQLKVTPADWNKWEDKISWLEDKTNIYEKQKNI
jgi:hypothetical protein